MGVFFGHILRLKIVSLLVSSSIIIIIMSLAFDEYGRPFLIVKVPTLAVPEYSHDHRLRVFAPALSLVAFFFAL